MGILFTNLPNLPKQFIFSATMRDNKNKLHIANHLSDCACAD